MEQHLGLEVQWSEVDFHHSTDFKSPGFVIVTASASSLPRTQSGTSPKRGADSGLFLPGCVTPPLPSLHLFNDPPLVLPTHSLHARRIFRDGLDSHSVCRKETFTT